MVQAIQTWRPGGHSWSEVDWCATGHLPWQDIVQPLLGERAFKWEHLVRIILICVNGLVPKSWLALGDLMENTCRVLCVYFLPPVLLGSPFLSLQMFHYHVRNFVVF